MRSRIPWLPWTWFHPAKNASKATDDAGLPTPGTQPSIPPLVNFWLGFFNRGKK